MANRFLKKKVREFPVIRSLVLPVLLFATLLLLVNFGMNRLSETTRQEQLRAAQSAVVRAAVQCYALEGQYPPDVQYLVDHYGLQVDQRHYIIHYQPIAGNLMPDIDVIPREV